MAWPERANREDCGDELRHVDVRTRFLIGLFFAALLVLALSGWVVQGTRRLATAQGTRRLATA